MSPHTISIDDLRKASHLASDRKRLMGLRGEQACGLHGVGPFLDEGAVAAILPAYRAWLDQQIGEITQDLVALGLSVTDPDYPVDDVVSFTAFNGNTQTYVGRHVVADNQ